MAAMIFKLREHYRAAVPLGRDPRLRPFPTTVEEIDAACQRDARRKNGLVDGYVRPIAWRGSGDDGRLGAEEPHQCRHRRLGMAVLFQAPAERLKGIRLDLRRLSPARSGDSAVARQGAAGLYMICTISKHEAERRGYADALMLDWEGYVAEATGANIFFVKDGVIHTPLADRFLNGITPPDA